MEKLMEKLLAMLKPEQICGVCILITVFIWFYANSVFASSDEFNQLKRRVDISAKIDLAQEIRRYQALFCASHDEEPILQALERLQTDYISIAGTRYPAARCADGRVTR